MRYLPFLSKELLPRPMRLQRVAPLYLTLLLGISACAGGNEADESDEEETSGSVQESEKKDPSPKDTSSSSPKDTTTAPEDSTSSKDTDQGSSTEPQKPKERDCEKVAWGSELKEDTVITRGNVKGYVDTDGDGVVEQTEQDAGMCQLHETGKKCGLVLYSRRT